jgi:anthranilate synthase component 2
MTNRILVIDNYDSFTYNLVHLVEKIKHQKIDVFYNDQIDLDAVAHYQKIILSPGPGIPSEAGKMMDIIQTYAPSKSILGVCLGHQGIGESMGGKLLNLEQVFHGVATPVHLYNTRSGLFKGLPNQAMVGRYHSWVISAESFPEILEVTARDNQGVIMGVKHKQFDVQGIQFHPESILTPSGEQIIHNWLAE